jgi:hypothetical protein
MNNSNWEMQKVAAMNGLIDDTVRLAGTIREKRVAERAQQLAEQEFRAGYAKALVVAKQTGVMPEQFQQRVPIDWVTSQTGLKVVALRELQKVQPKHPLLNQVVRDSIAKQTLVNFNRADRPEGANFNDFAPSDTQTQQIFNQPR